MLNNPDLRAGTKNTLELSTFFNLLSTVELSKCQPYFDATFILPGEVKNLMRLSLRKVLINQKELSMFMIIG